jgi:choline kinase
MLRDVQATILVAGLGRRLGLLSESMPKCLVSIKGKPLISYHLESLIELGVKDITLVIGHQSEKIVAFLAKSPSYSSVKYLYNPFYSLADSIVSLWLYLVSKQSSQKPLIVVSGDRIFNPIVYQTILERCSSFTLAVIGPSQFSVIPKDSVALVDDHVVSIGEASPYVYGGVMFVPVEDLSLFLTTLEKILHHPEGFRKWYLEGIKELLLKRHKIRAIKFPPWSSVNINKPEDLNNPLVELISGSEGRKNGK